MRLSERALQAKKDAERREIEAAEVARKNWWEKNCQKLMALLSRFNFAEEAMSPLRPWYDQPGYYPKPVCWVDDVAFTLDDAFGGSLRVCLPCPQCHVGAAAVGNAMRIDPNTSAIAALEKLGDIIAEYEHRPRLCPQCLKEERERQEAAEREDRTKQYASGGMVD